jgi:hypothetical protein
MSDSPSVDRTQANTRQKNSDNLTAKGANPSGCSTATKVAAPQAKAEYAKSHPHPYQKR